MIVNTKIHTLATKKDNISDSIVFNEDSVKKETIGQFSQRIRFEKGLSVADVAEKSNAAISTSYISKLENEPNVNPSTPKLQALAKGLGESEELVFAIARGTKPDLYKQFASLFAELTESRQKDLIEIAKLYLYERRKTQLDLGQTKTLDFEDLENSKDVIRISIDQAYSRPQKKKSIELDEYELIKNESDDLKLLGSRVQNETIPILKEGAGANDRKQK